MRYERCINKFQQTFRLKTQHSILPQYSIYFTLLDDFRAWELELVLDGARSRVGSF